MHRGLRLATLLKKRLWHRCFPVNFVKYLRTPLVAASASIFFCKVIVGFKKCLPSYNPFDLAKVLSFSLLSYGAFGISSMKVVFRSGLQSWWQFFTKCGGGNRFGRILMIYLCKYLAIWDLRAHDFVVQAVSHI